MEQPPVAPRQGCDRPTDPELGVAKTRYWLAESKLAGRSPFVAPWRRPLTRPSGTLSPLPRGEGDEYRALELGLTLNSVNPKFTRGHPEPMVR
jgi:hypothetical protein